MKKLLFILLSAILVSVVGFSQQSSWFTGISTDSAKAFCDSLLNNAGGGFKLKEHTEAEKNGDTETFEFANSERVIAISFRYFNKEGKPTYYLKRAASASLDDIFPFWKRFVLPASEKDEVLKKRWQDAVVKKGEVNSPDKKAVLSKVDSFWEIAMF